jgi:hypothetical protein
LELIEQAVALANNEYCLAGKLCHAEIINAFKKMGIVISDAEASQLRKR